MALDEYLFGKFINYFQRLKGPSDEEKSRTVSLNEIKPKLTLFGRAASASAVDIFPAEREGGYKNNSFFLPASSGIFPSRELNLSFYLFRTLYLSVQKRLKLNWHQASEEVKGESQLRAQGTSAQVLHLLFNEFPATRDIHAALLACLNDMKEPGKEADVSWLYGKWMVNQPEEVSHKKLENISNKVKLAGKTEKPITILKAKAVESISTLEVDKKQQEDYVLTHNFEKVETADEFNGVWRDFDGEDELKDHEAALDELNMKFTVRVDDQAHSVYQAEFTENTNVSESVELEGEGHFITYHEWDYSKRAYKMNYCKVYPINSIMRDPEYYTKTIKQNQRTLLNLRKMLASLSNKRVQLKRQTQGSEFDIDAVTDLVVDVMNKRTPSERIYLSSRKKEKELSILILLDISLSSDAYASNNRVIDVEKEVCILFGEILNENNIDFAIKCFYSKTRNYSSYLTVKDFDENWNKAKYKVGGIEPQGYTRIGAALRHSGALLKKRYAKNKWVILISDGKPNDFDKYEGRYGIQDVKQSLRELNENGISSYALAIESEARYYLPQMFGQSNHQVLSEPKELIHAMTRLYDKMKEAG